MVSTFVKGFIPGAIGIASALIPFPPVPVIVFPIALMAGGILFKGFNSEEDGMKYVAGTMVACCAGTVVAFLLGLSGLLNGGG